MKYYIEVCSCVHILSAAEVSPVQPLILMRNKHSQMAQWTKVVKLESECNQRNFAGFQIIQNNISGFVSFWEGKKHMQLLSKFFPLRKFCGIGFFLMLKYSKFLQMFTKKCVNSKLALDFNRL